MSNVMSRYPKRTSLSGAKSAAQNKPESPCEDLRIKSWNLGNTVCLYDREGKIVTTLPLTGMRSPLSKRSEIFSNSCTLAYRDWETDRKSTRLNSSHSAKSRMPSSA